jgi:DNA-binding PadR family transcriptional regulator
MIEHELILLGLLKESPKHGYYIKTKVREILSLFAGVNLKSIYYPLRVLEKKGLVVKHAGKQGKRPQRLVYALTAKGKERFDKLLIKSFLDFTRPQFSLDVSLYFLHYVPRRLVVRRLRARLSIVRRLAEKIAQAMRGLQKRKDFASARILEHNLHMLQAEDKFLSHLVASL